MDEQPFYRVLDEGTTASGTLIASDDVEICANVIVSPNVVADEDANVAVADDESLIENGPTNDVSANDALNVSSNDEASVSDNVVNGDSYAAGTAGVRETPRRRSSNNRLANEVPDRLRSAFSTRLEEYIGTHGL